ncbi:MAG: hypothetical protein IT578_03390 [Verrucomicrobiae bacterium]|nr:hypothetical protein [Verrucomicrobiae bacterium]
MNDDLHPPGRPPPLPQDSKRSCVNMQLPVPREIYQTIKDQLTELSRQTGVDFPMVKFASRTLQNHWKTELERARRSFERYARGQG